ncbi:hypothetical protein SAMN02745857_00504 [Andreprevotia lacus DSM 23236]|uniref:Uncharacterized protein n=1 Tax=Andreprevotia lacus DSM 23236 TaxID=1121001 RepID=A0A1W1X307_9NEIS|nr:hypothetical protein SAMN02745857_00504 [Andreprevotia lacus DSM 23236]
MCIQAAFKAYPQFSKAGKPGVGTLHNPPMLPKAFSAIHATSGDTRQNATLAQIGPTTPVVIPFVRMQLVGPAARLPSQAWHRG